MAKAPEIGGEHIAFAAGLLWVANYTVATWWGYPFLFCWLSPAVTTLYLGWGILALYLVAACILYHLFAGSTLHAIKWALIGAAVIELPRLCDHLFRLGASCG